MDELVKIAIGISGISLGGILGYLFRVQIEHRLAIYRIKESIEVTERSKARAAFRAAFAPAIAKFNITKGVNEIDAMLRDELITQSVAIELFRPFVSGNNMGKYQEAWNEYHQSHKRDGVSSVYFLDYAMGDEQERFSLFRRRIERILSFSDV